jgi:hypothetical protein
MVSPVVALAAASDRFRSHIPAGCRRPSVGDIEEAGRSLRAEVDVGAWAWRQACELIGAYPAALCLLIADRRAAEGEVSSIGGYFLNSVRRAPAGKLRLDRSIRALANPRAAEERAAVEKFRAEAGREVRYDA